MSRKILHSLILCLTALMLSSCVTSYMWGDKKYDEKIDQFFIGADGRYVVFVSPEYHYIFTDNSGNLARILSLKQKNILTINKKKSHLKLDSNNDIKGPLVFEGPFSILPVEDIAALQSMGFRPDKRDNVSIKLELTGRRYAAKYVGQSSVLETNNQISIYYNDSGLVKGMGKAAITPVTVTLDAVLLIGKIVVYPMNHPEN